MRAFLRYFGYLMSKWTVFYIYQYIEADSKWDWSKVKTFEDVFYTSWMLLAMPLLELLILAFPIYFALKQKGKNLIFMLIGVFVLEFTLGWFLTNEQFSSWMVVKILLSIALFTLFYRNKLSFKGSSILSRGEK